MSAHYSKFALNSYCNTPYFEANAPKDYPIFITLQKCRAFRRLPTNLKELATLSRRWSKRKYPGFKEIEEWYDDEGYELNPSTQKRLTDEEIDKQWHDSEELDKFEVKDIPKPKGGFADPDTWEEPPPKKEEPRLVDRAGMTKAEVLSYIKSHGRNRVADTFGVPKSQLKSIKSDKQLAREILGMHGKPWPARDKEDDSNSTTLSADHWKDQPRVPAGNPDGGEWTTIPAKSGLHHIRISKSGHIVGGNILDDWKGKHVSNIKSHAAKAAPILPSQVNQATADSRKFQNAKDAHDWGYANFIGWVEGMDKDEWKAVGRYSFNTYRDINNVLRATNGKPEKANKSSQVDPSLDVAGSVKLIDKSLEKSVIPEDITVYRGVASGLADKLVPSYTHVEHGYSSTSLNPEAGDNYAYEATIELRVPKGSKGGYLQAMTKNPNSTGNEQEMLLPRGGGYKVLSVESRDGKKHIVAEWQSPKQKTEKKSKDDAALSTDASGHQHKGKGKGGGQFTATKDSGPKISDHPAKVAETIKRLDSGDGLVALADLRDALEKDGLSREEQDAALLVLRRSGAFGLVPHEGRHGIDDRSRAAAVKVANSDGSETLMGYVQVRRPYRP